MVKFPNKKAKKSEKKRSEAKPTRFQPAQAGVEQYRAHEQQELIEGGESPKN